jgi:PAS domain S-box-containing protein
VRWIVALVGVAVAAGLRFALDPWLGAAHPFPLFLGAVIVAAWFGGIAPAVVAGLAGYLVADYFFVEPRGLFAPRNAVEMAGLGVYVLSSALIVGLGGAMHAARRRAEASEERFRRFMENSPAAVFVKDDAGRYVYMNAAAQAIVSVPDWRGKTDAELLPPAAAREVHAHDAKVLADQAPGEFDLTIGERQFRSTKFPLRDAGGRLVIGAVSMDVTVQARAAEELRRQREELRLVTDTMPAGVVCVSADLRYIWVNRTFASWIGRAPGEIIGRPVAEVLAERDWLDLRPHVERTLRGERVEYERLARFAAGERWIHSVMESTRDEGGAPNGLVAVVSDIHDRKLMEETLRQAERRKDEFLATLAHELRNPLAPIRNAVAILGKKDALDPELTWSREVIERQVDQMSRLIDDLLDIARIAGGKLLIRKERLPLERAIDMALETSRPHINAAGHSLAVLLPSERVTVEADPARLAQVFSNLLNNAARYTERHGEIALTAEVQGEEVVVTVQDNGIGFPPEVAGRLFEPFSQLTRSNERSHGGLGIGLSLVQGIVALHGGSVQARSRGPGQGAEFAVRLPLPKFTDPVQPAKPAAQPRPPAPLGSVKVLVADDNRDAADSLQRILSLYGYEVEVAYDGTAAIRLDGDFRPEVAVLDIGMPGANGFEVARSIRENRGAGVTLIALTGWGQEGDRRRAMEAGFDYHLTKPVDPGALNDLLVEVADR